MGTNKKEICFSIAITCKNHSRCDVTNWTYLSILILQKNESWMERF